MKYEICEGTRSVLALPNMLAAGAGHGDGSHHLVSCCLQTGQGLVITYVMI